MSTVPNIRFFTKAENQAPPRKEAIIDPVTIARQTAELEQAFQASPAPMPSFWEKQTTAILQKVLAGFERSFDDLSTDSDKAKYLPSADWHTNRMALIRGILEVRWSERQAMPVEMRGAYDEVKSGQAKSVKRWNGTGGKGA